MSQTTKDASTMNESNSAHEELTEITEEKITEKKIKKDQEDVAHLVNDAQSEMMMAHDRYLRLAAEFENYKKRTEREQLNSVRFAAEGLLRDLLPVLDNLEQALLAAEAGQKTEDKSYETVITGLKMVLKHFQDTLGRFGIQSFSALGLTFDPLKHEAVLEREIANVPSGQVLEEFQKGYMLHERLVRPARVVVAKS
jgi:molecular chaperone GrpE